MKELSVVEKVLLIAVVMLAVAFGYSQYQIRELDQFDRFVVEVADTTDYNLDNLDERITETFARTDLRAEAAYGAIRDEQIEQQIARERRIAEDIRLAQGDL